MPKAIILTYSSYYRNAVALLGALIRETRNERRLMAQELADRAGISRGMLQRMEKGNPKCEIAGETGPVVAGRVVSWKLHWRCPSQGSGKPWSRL